MKKNKNFLYVGIIGLCIVFNAAFMGCEAGLSSGSNDDSEDFSFSEMYANISNLENEINNLKQVVNNQAETITVLSGTQSNSANGLQQAITLNESRISTNETELSNQYSRIGVNETELSSQYSRIGVNETALSSQYSRIGANESQINKLNDLVEIASPVGTIVPFAGPEANIPDGWLLCDGDSYDRDSYPDLFQAIGTSWGAPDSSQFNLPDFQGRFLRGLDIAGTIDPGRSVGSYQDDAFQDHRHTWSFYEADIDSHSDRVNYWDTSSSNPSSTPQTQYTSYSYNGRSAAETRPKNAAVNYIIKY
ncbi:MAG: hypothetical protein GY754_21410 [bacterium]|nr:hypothetical protein [bacterium]